MTFVSTHKLSTKPSASPALLLTLALTPATSAASKAGL